MSSYIAKNVFSLVGCTISSICRLCSWAKWQMTHLLTYSLEQDRTVHFYSNEITWRRHQMATACVYLVFIKQIIWLKIRDRITELSPIKWVNARAVPTTGEFVSMRLVVSAVVLCRLNACCEATSSVSAADAVVVVRMFWLWAIRIKLNETWL